MVFCSIIRGQCQGRANCQIWVRGRIHKTDAKLLAAQLARFALQQECSQINPQILTPELTATFWKTQGIPNIQQAIITDRYLREKVSKIEEIATQWLASTGYHKSILNTTLAMTKEGIEPHTQHCKSPP